MKILLTGASGLLGRHAVERLRSHRHEVTTVSRSRKLESASLLADLADPAQVRTLPGGFDAIVHLAALLPAPGRRVEDQDWFRNNTQSTLNLLEHARSHGIGTFVYGSTWSVYGAGPAHGPATEEQEPRPTDPYSVSKLAGELLAGPYAFNYGIKVRTLRFSYIYGAGMRQDTVIEQFIDRARRNAPIALVNRGLDRTDLIHVEDAAEAVAFALERGSGAYNIGSGQSVTIREIAEAIVSLTRSSSPLQLKDDDRPLRRLALSIDKAARELAWGPRHALTSGLGRFIDQHSDRAHGAKELQ